MDTTTLVAALLHDTVEDTRYTLAKRCDGDFGHEVALLVDGVTKFDKALLRPGGRGRDDPQDDRRGRQGRPGAGHQARRPAAQHAHARRPLPRLAGPHRQGHPRGAGAALRPARHPGAQARARRRGALPPRARRLRHASTSTCSAPRTAGTNTSPGRADAGQEALRRSRVSADGVRPAAALLLDLEGHRAGRQRRPARPAARRGGRRRQGDRLLRRPRRHPRQLAAGPRPVQGLHRLAEEQPLPLAAHHGDRPGRPHRSRC